MVGGAEIVLEIIFKKELKVQHASPLTDAVHTKKKKTRALTALLPAADSATQGLNQGIFQGLPLNHKAPLRLCITRAGGFEWVFMKFLFALCSCFAFFRC